MELMIHFLLTPDRSSSLALKRAIAQEGARTDVMVGTWPELLALAKGCHVLPPTVDNWEERLELSVKASHEAFWASSLESVPTESQQIVNIVGQHLTLLLEGCGPDARLESLAERPFPARLSGRLRDFSALYDAMGGVLPHDLAAIRSILEVENKRVLKPISVYSSLGWPRLNPWQQRLVDTLNERAGQAEDASLRTLLEAAVAKPCAAPGTSLNFLQHALFTLPPSKSGRDETVQWLSVRDYLQEVEVAAGMIQTAIRKDSSLNFSDFALVIPEDERYHSAAAEVFSSAGILLADMGKEDSVRDLAGETLVNLLLSLNKPAPVMAMASLLSSPLMPWPRFEGNRLAQEVIKSRFQLVPYGDDPKFERMIDAVLSPLTDTESLRKRLKRFASLLNSRPEFEQHAARAVNLCNDLAGFLEGKEGEIPWTEMMSQVSAQPLPSSGRALVCREAVAVFCEGDEPWRTVKHLLVLGCSEEHYPGQRPSSKVFNDEETVALRETGQLEIETAVARNERLRQVFRRQLCSASAGITFLIPRRDPMGAALSPSAALIFSSVLFADVEDAEDLFVELSTSEGLAKARGVPTTQVPASGQQVPSDKPTELRFGTNLVELGRRPDGSLKPESPSRLEKLMVSPLGWLFDRLGVEPREWSPETLDVMSQGTLAHAVFEELFSPDDPLPSASRIEAQVPSLFAEAIQSRMPFLLRDEWRVEREHLKKGILKAALRWGEILQEIGAAVIATEIPLQGRLGDLPINGDADLLLSLPGNRLLVVDYKKSSSGERRTRMKQGYDHQAELYRTMLKTGGLRYPEKAPEGLAEKLEVFKNAGQIGTLYYLLNNQIALSDTAGWIPRTVAGTEEMSVDTSGAAIELIRRRISELSDGLVDLKLIESEKDLKQKRGLGVYVLDSSPLIRKFLAE